MISTFSINAKVLVLMDYSVYFPTSTNDLYKKHGHSHISENDLLKIKVDFLDYMYSKKYNENMS